MVRINSVVLAGLAAVGALARPARRQVPGTCMTDEQAAFVAHNYGTLIANYTNALADQVLAPNFTDYSESVNTLINTCPQGAAAISLPLLSPTFTSRQMFEIGQGQQPSINFEQLNIWTSCEAVVIRWMTTNTAPIADAKPVVGLIAMEVVPNPNITAAITYPWLIDYVYSEFDAGAWLQNLQEAGICGPAPGPCDSQQVPPEATPTASASVSSVPSSVPISPASSSSSPAASPYSSSTGSGSGSAPAYVVSPTSTSSAPVVTSITTVVVTVNPDGTVSEEPCEE